MPRSHNWAINQVMRPDSSYGGRLSSRKFTSRRGAKPVIRTRSALSAVVALACAFALVGCGSSSGAGSRQLTLLAWDTGQDNDPLDTAVTQFKQANPGVTVTVKKTPYTQYEQSLRLQMSSGRPPDVARVVLGYGDAGTALSLADKNLLTDLSSAPWASQIPAAAVVTTNKGAKTYAFPAESSVLAAIYQPATFTKYRLAVPKTYADVLKLCATFRAKTGHAAIALGGASGSLMPAFYVYGLVASSVYATQPDYGTRRLNGAVTFSDTAGWQQALTKFDAARGAGCFDKNAAGLSQQSASAAVAQGTALFAVGLDATLPLFQAGNPGAKLRVFPFPGTDDPSKLRVATAPVVGLAVPARARNVTLARKFLDFYAAHRIAYSQRDNTIPSIPARGKGSALPAYARSIAPYLPAKTVTLADALWPSPDVETQLENGLVKLLLNNGSEQGVLRGM